MVDDAENITWGEKVQALERVVRFRPRFTVALVMMGGVVAFLEGIGLSFIYPILEVAQEGGRPEAQDGIMEAFLAVYDATGVPFTLEYLIVGVAGIMTIRYTSSFVVSWLGAILQQRYEEEMRRQAFERALEARVEYYDQEGTDDILNAIITETRYAGKVIKYFVRTTEQLALATVYLAVMVFISPLMTAFAIVLLGGITLFLRFVIEPAYTVGTRVAQSNQNVQEAVQAGTQGIRDVKLFGLTDEVYEQFQSSIRRYTDSSIAVMRNEAAIKNFYELSAALSIFVLIYVGFVFSDLSLGALGIFLFAMFMLAPVVSNLNSNVYKMEGNLSHVVRTHAFVDELNERLEREGDRSVERIEHIEFDDVRFSYDSTDERVLRGLNFAVERGEFVAFVGQSGAGKSTVVSLLARMYDPDDGDIRADGVPIEAYDLREWRSRIAVVRQNPFIFNDTLERNVTIGKRDATRADVERVCAIARVDEFLGDLPNGYESELGDEGVRLSGGQRQRVALARALLKDADFLVLDEATSDLDSSLEKEVQDAIESMDREYGIVAIAHRLSTVQNADRIYTMDDGEIVERGTHGELLGEEGEYAALYTIQSRG